MMLGKLWITDKDKQKLINYDPIRDKKISTIELSELVTSAAPNFRPVPDSDPPMWVEEPPLAGKEPRMFDEEPQDVVTSVSPQGISLDSNNDIYVSDWDNHRMIVLDDAGSFVVQSEIQVSTSRSPYLKI